METRERIIFINPPAPIPGKIWIRDINRSGRLSRQRTIWPQSSLALLAAVFPDDDVKIFDCIAEGWGYKKLFDEMQSFNPTWVVSNPVSSSFTHDMIVSMYGKSLGAKTVIISPHSKAFEKEVHSRFPFLDHAVNYYKGGTEYEYQLQELIKGIPSQGKKFEDLPPARQDLLPIHKYNLPFIGKGYTFLIASRGCGWACSYCRATVQNERFPRFRPVVVCIEEIKRYNLRNIAFHADTFTMNRKWVLDFCEEVKKLPFKVRWICNSRVDKVDLELLKEMKSSGCWMICFGAESGDDEVLKANRKDATVAQAREAFKLAKKVGLRTWFYGMLGMYKDTKETMEKTIRLSKELNPDIANFAIAAPYPGTEFYEIAKKNKWIADERWESFDQDYSAQVDQPDCSRELVKTMQKKAYLEWYFSPRGFKFLLNGFKPEYLSYFFNTIRDHLRA